MIFSTTPKDSAEAATASEVTATAKQYIGIPYVYGGTTTRGFDCSGFTSRVFSDLGVKLNRTSGSQYGQGATVAKANLQAGDLLFFNTSGRGVSHVAIYIGSGKMIHSQTGKGVSISNLNDPYYWGSRYIGAKRVAKLDSAEVAVAVKKTTTVEKVATVAKAEVKQATIDFTVYASRSEVAKQLAAALNLDTSNTNTGFADVKSTDANAGAIATVANAGIFSGDNGKFNPASPITRGQLAKVLVLAFDLEKGDKVVDFKDIDDNHPSAEYISILASQEITIGKGNGVYGSSDKVTLKQLDAFIDRSKN